MLPLPRTLISIESMAAAIGFVVLFGVIAASYAQTSQRPSAGYETDTLVIETGSGGHRFSVELARTVEQQAQGLMFRRTLAADAGMLFLYAVPSRISMWMKNTLIPLDMIFIGSDGRVVDIAQRAVPLSVEPIYAAMPAIAVLEVNGGTTARLGIRNGDLVRHRAFGTAAAK